LVYRDINERVRQILLPYVDVESDAYPVVSPEGDIYMLYWARIEWPSPHGFGDVREGKFKSIYRKFAILLVNMKNGRIEGYLMNKDRDDYILSFYRAFYKQWDKPLPEWLKEQLRYPEEVMEKEIDVYNIYHQKNHEEFWGGHFYELPRAREFGIVEDVRYIVFPINGKLEWAATSLLKSMVKIPTLLVYM
jgi:uncharacterized membrane protein (UPF0182 family)